MSLELVLVFALANPPSSEALQAALDRRGIPIRVSHSGDMQRHTGFLPVEYESRRTGFYVTQLNYQEFTSDYPEGKTQSGMAKAVFSLGWGGNFLECASVFQVASILVSEFGATAFDTESVSYLTLQDISNGAAACYEESKKQMAPNDA